LGFIFLLPCEVSVSAPGDLLWQRHYDREGALDDGASDVAVSPVGSSVFAAGRIETSAGGWAFSVRAYEP
jgi:hypothetical protein